MRATMTERASVGAAATGILAQPAQGTRGLRIKIDTSGRHSDRPDVDDSHQQDLLSRSPLAADLRRSLKSGVDHRPSWAAGAALSPAASLAPAAAAPASTEVGLETRTGPFQERIEAEHRFRTVCRALLAPGLLPGPARPDEPDASSLAGRVAVARWAARAMGMPAVVLERAVAEALDANRQLLATYERQHRALRSARGGDGTPSAEHFLSPEAFAAWRESELEELERIAGALRAMPEFQASARVCLVGARDLPDPPKGGRKGLAALMSCCMAPASEDEGLNAFAVVTLGPSPGAVYGDARHVRHASAASGVGGGGGADRVIGGARVVMGNTGSAGSSAGAVCASVANAVFATEPRVNSRSPAWHAAAPAALITTRESDRLRIEIRHDPSASRALSDEAVRALGAGEGTPRYQADGRGGGVEVRGGHLRVEGGPDYAMMTGIGEELSRGGGGSAMCAMSALEASPTDAAAPLLGWVEVPVDAGGVAVTAKRVLSKMAVDPRIRDRLAKRNVRPDPPNDANWPALDLFIECVCERGQVATGAGGQPGAVAVGPTSSYRERVRAVGAAMGAVWRAWDDARRLGAGAGVAVGPMDAHAFGGVGGAMAAAVEAAYQCAGHVPTGTALFVAVKLCAYLRVRGEALCLCLARHLLERWAEEAGYLVSLRCAVVPVAAAMRGGTMNRVEHQMALDLMSDLASRVVQVLDDLYLALPEKQMSACLKALVSLAGMALLQDPYPVGFDEALKVHVKRSARNQVIRVLSQQEQSLEEAVGAVTRAVRTAKEAIVGDLVVAHALPGSRGVAQAASATRYSVIAAALGQIFSGMETVTYTAAVQLLEDAMAEWHEELRRQGMVRRKVEGEGERDPLSPSPPIAITPDNPFHPANPTATTPAPSHARRPSGTPRDNDSDVYPTPASNPPESGRQGRTSSAGASVKATPPRAPPAPSPHAPRASFLTPDSAGARSNISGDRSANATPAPRTAGRNTGRNADRTASATPATPAVPLAAAEASQKSLSGGRSVTKIVDGEIELVDLEAMLGSSIRAWVGAVAEKLVQWVGNNIAADSFEPAGSDRAQRHSMSVIDLFQLLGAVTEQVMRRAALGPPSRHASVALQLERGMGAAFQAYAVAIERLCLDALDPKRAPAVIERSVGGAGGGEGGNAAWTTKRLATMLNNLRAIEVRQFQVKCVLRDLATKGRVTAWGGEQMDESSGDDGNGGNDGHGHDNGDNDDDIDDDLSLEGGSSSGGGEGEGGSAGKGGGEGAGAVGRASDAAGEMLRSTILRVLGELGWRVRELVGFHVRHALTAVRRQGAGAMEGEMAGEGAEGEPFRKQGLIARVKAKYQRYLAKKAAKRAPKWAAQAGGSASAQTPAMGVGLGGGGAGSHANEAMAGAGAAARRRGSRGLGRDRSGSTLDVNAVICDETNPFAVTGGGGWGGDGEGSDVSEMDAGLDPSLMAGDAAPMDDGAGSRELSGPGVMASLPSDVASAYLGGGGEAAVVALKAYLDSEMECMYLSMVPAVFNLAMSESWSACLRLFEDLLLHKDTAIAALGTPQELDMARVLFVEILEHFHGDSLGLPRRQLERTSRRVARLFDLHYSSTKVLRKVFFALKAQVIERRTHLLPAAEAGAEGAGAAGIERPSVSFASLSHAGPSGQDIARAVTALGPEGVSMLDVLEVLRQRAGRDEQAAEVVSAEGDAARRDLLSSLFGFDPGATSLVASHPCALDDVPGTLFVTTRFLAFAPHENLRHSWDPRGAVDGAAAAPDRRVVVPVAKIAAMDAETMGHEEAVVMIGPDHERHVFSRFAARQRDVLLSTLWTAVSGTGTALEAYLAKQMRGAAEGVGGVLPAGEAVLRSYKCAKITKDRLRLKHGTLYVCFKHLVFDSTECTRKTIPYVDVLKVTCEHSDLHGPVVTFKVPVYDKKRLKLAGFESRQDAVDLVSVISGLCDVHRR